MKNDLKFRTVTAGTKETSLHIGDVDCVITLEYDDKNQYILKFLVITNKAFEQACTEVFGEAYEDNEHFVSYLLASSWKSACDQAREKIIECLEAYSVLVMDEYDTIVQFADEFNGVVN